MEKLLLLTDSLWLSVLIWSVLIISALYPRSPLGTPGHHGVGSPVARQHADHWRAPWQATGMHSAHAIVKCCWPPAGRAKERLVTREFERITATVNRDLAPLSGNPATAVGNHSSDR